VAAAQGEYALAESQFEKATRHSNTTLCRGKKPTPFNTDAARCSQPVSWHAPLKSLTLRSTSTAHTEPARGLSNTADGRRAQGSKFPRPIRLTRLRRGLRNSAPIWSRMPGQLARVPENLVPANPSSTFRGPNNLLWTFLWLSTQRSLRAHGDSPKPAHQITSLPFVGV
jgi:hypothetical protein